MSTVTYQPSYSTSKGGRFGFRYLAQPPAPNIGNPAIPPNQTVDSSQATPSKTMGSGANMQDPFVGDSDFEFAANKIPAAQALGYTQGNRSLLNAIPVVSTIARMTGYEAPTDTYGNYGTYDAEGNVFGTEGRAYDPITGRAAQSYATPSDFYGSYLGIGTEGGFLGPDSSYGKLRAAGEGPIQSLLGSYENSLYRQQELNPNLNTAQARAAMLRGTADASGVPTMQGIIEANTAMYDPAYAAAQGFADDDIDRMGGTEVTREMLGFTDARPDPGPISGRFGTKTGDVARTEMGLGVINQSGQIETPTGTVVAISDPYNPGKNISLLGSTLNSTDGKSTLSAKNELARNQVLDARSNPEGSGMSGFNVSDGDGGSYQTDSSGTAGAGTAQGSGIYGMEDEYDDDDGPSNDSVCFITTAIVNRRGEADDGETLTKLRAFRDTFMGGKKSDDLKEYYAIAPAIIEAIPEDHSDWDWIEKQIDLSIAKIDNDQPNDAYDIYKAMVLKLKETWL